MHATRDRFSLGLIALMIMGQALHSDAQDLDEFMQALIMNELPDSAITVAESTYQRLARTEVQPEDCAEWHQSTSTILMAGLTGQRDLYANSVLFDIEQNTCPDPEGNWWPYLMGNACFMTNNYEKAAAFFSRVNWTPASDDSDFAIYINARLNLSSAFNAMSSIDRAILTIEDLIRTCNSYEHDTGNELEVSLFTNLNINLAGLLISNRDFERAEATLQTIDVNLLNPQWQQVVKLNQLIIFQETGRFEQSDSLWMNELRLSELAGIPEGTFNILIRQSLLSNDPLGFMTIRDFIVTHLPHILEDESFYYTKLVQSGTGDEGFEERWIVYSGIEKERSTTFALQLKAVTQKRNTRIERLTSELELRKRATLRWQRIALSIALALLAIVGGYAILQRQRSVANQRKLDALLSSASTESRAEPLELRLDDIRILGDAIGLGKRTADAMLILKKISMKVMPDNFPKQLDLTSLENFHELSTSEQKILADMMAGFDAKEIARVMNLSPSHIYNSRSNIRRKLEIPKEQSIKDWVISRTVQIAANSSGD
jgi:DNA-binding CsgD family transcriptional regulator